MTEPGGGSGGKGRKITTVISPDDERPSGSLSVSVLWAYIVALALMILPPFILIGDPWGVATDLRLYDEIWVIAAGAIDDGDYQLSARPFTWVAFILSIVAIIFSYRVRAHRQVMVGRHFGIPHDQKNAVHAFFFGRGMNVLFPYGPADQSTAAALVKNGAPAEAATTTVFYYRAFEILAILSALAIGLLVSGWAGVGLPFLYCFLLFCGVSVVIRPLGRFSGGKGFLATLGVQKVFEALREIGKAPGLATRLYLISLGAFALELIGLYLIKNAFSAGDIGDGDEYLLMEGVPFAAYIVALAVASLARIIPFTPGGMGVYEISMVTVFQFYEAEATNAAATAMADGFITNFIMLCGFFIALRSGAMPSVLGAWKAFFRQSAHRLRNEPIDDERVLGMA